MYTNYSQKWKWFITLNEQTKFNNSFSKEDFFLLGPEETTQSGTEEDLFDAYDEDERDEVLDILNAAKSLNEFIDMYNNL